MKHLYKYKVPPSSTLVAFECAGRLCSFSQAAQELSTFQPHISRQIATLEKRVSARLFERSQTGVTLTEAGDHLYNAIAPALGVIHQAIVEVEGLSRPKDEEVVIVCSHSTSQFVLLPRYNALCQALGERVRVRILTYDRHIGELLPDSVADVVLTWNNAQAAPKYRVPVLKEAVRPVCSPAYAAAHADELSRPVAHWGALTFIDYTRPNDGWATWNDWFAVAGRPKGRPTYLDIDKYLYVLEAAAAGRGLALGWKGWIEQHLAAGTLVALGEGFYEFDRFVFCALTGKGQANASANACLAFFAQEQPSADD